jgi:hypothetical protein
MALTDFGTPQMMTLFEVLEVPYAQDYQLWRLTRQGDGVYSGNSLDLPALTKAYNQILTIVSGMSGSGLDRITGWLTNYSDLGNEDIEIVGGSLGEGVNGINYSSAKERDNIARKVRVVIPCYRAHEMIVRGGPRAINFVS